MSVEDVFLIEREIFQVLLNHLGQYSVWPAAQQPPPGWDRVGPVGSKHDCLAYIEATWLDMRPATLCAVAESGIPVDTTANEIPSSTLPQLIEAQAGRTPNAIALIFGEERISYADLDARANRLARLLAGEGTGPESLVAVALPRSIDMIVAVLGVLKSGGAYVPLDPDYPPQRVLYMLEDSKVSRLIGTSKTIAALQDFKGTLPPALRVDDAEFAQRLLSQPSHPLTDAERIAPLTPQNLAYLIYTSGSSGRPKASLHTHANVVNLAWRPAYVDIDPNDTLLQFAPLAFDAHIFEVWAALMNGSRLLLAASGPPDLALLSAECLRHDVSIAWMTSGLFAQAAASDLPMLGRLRHLIAGGDVLPVQSVQRVLAAHPKLRLTNGYGPTETTTFASTHSIGSGDFSGTALPIGSAIRNVQLYVLDASMSPVQEGLAGELYIAGDGLARGYHRRPGLTAERFIACPFGPPGGRMYRTGDSARWRPDGVLDFLGRIDEQIKIRGFRVEPGEIEAALLRSPELLQASVQLSVTAGGPRLVAYLVPRSGERVPPDEKLRDLLLEALPKYMVPGAFVPLSRLPLTPNGKLDRRALPAPAQPSIDGERPANETERLLADIWKELLGLDEIAKTTDFFSAGGHSFLAIRLLVLVEKQFGVSLHVTDLFNAPTIEYFAIVVQKAIENQRTTKTERIPATPAAVGSLANVRKALKLRLVRPARTTSRGSVLGMPSLSGDSGAVGVIAGNALDAYDIWSFSVDLRPRTLTEDYIWLAIAEEIAERIITATVVMPKAFVGFSIGGYMGWLVDRMLIAAGQKRTPVISFDGGLYHNRFPGWSDRIAHLLKRCAVLEPARVLLLMRKHPKRLKLIDSPDSDWRSAGVELQTSLCPTLDHTDLILPAAIASAREVLQEFIESGRISSALHHDSFALSTVGGAAFQMLSAATPPSPAAVCRLIEPVQLPADGTVRLGLLLLALASGDAALALSFSKRLVEAEPHHRAALYAQIGVLATLGRSTEAASLAQSWSVLQSPDAEIQARAVQTRRPHRAWESWPELVLGSDASLDFAVSLLQNQSLS